MISTRKKSPFFALTRSRAAENFKPMRTPQEGGFVELLGREGGRIWDLWGRQGWFWSSKGAPKVIFASWSGGGVVVGFGRQKDQLALGRRGKSARKRKKC